jgi:hypothetical protein
MSAMLISASVADLDENRPIAQQHELASLCESVLNELNKDSLVSNKQNELAFNRCLSYYLAKFLTTVENNDVNVSDEEDDEAKVRDTRRAKSIKHFWKRRAGSAKAAKKFW